MLLVALGLAGLLAQSADPVAAPAVVTGRIVDDATRAGIAGVRVMLFPIAAAGGGPPVSFDGRPPVALTDRDGRYSFDNLAPGRYRINVQKAGFASVTDRVVQQQFDIAAGQRRELREIPLQRGAAIAGRVLDDHGQPLAGARVTALRRLPTNVGARAGTPPGPFVGSVASAESNDLGEFRLFGLAPGEYLVGARPAPMLSERAMPRDTTFIPTYFPGTSDTAAAQPIVLSSGQTYSEVAIWMVAVHAFQVSGIVRNQAGVPVTNALVQWRSTDTSLATVMMTGPNQVHTDSAGRFAIANVTAGSYTLSAVAPVVISRADTRRVGVGGATMGMTFSGGIVGGSVGGGMTTETRNGVTTQWREDTATRLPITIGDSDAHGLEIVVRTP